MVPFSEYWFFSNSTHIIAIRISVLSVQQGTMEVQRQVEWSHAINKNKAANHLNLQQWKWWELAKVDVQLTTIQRSRHREMEMENIHYVVNLSKP